MAYCKFKFRSSIKEFNYVPVKHYLEHNEDTLILKTIKFKFKKSFYTNGKLKRRLGTD